MLISIITINKVEIYQMNINFFFLNGTLMKRFTWNNQIGLLLIDKKRKSVSLSSLYMI
jgi:hypothetical protein